MKYITLLLIIGMSLITTTQVTGQRDGDKRQEMEQMKIAYLTKAMSLSTEDAQKFWPIYNKYQDQYESLRERKERGDREREDKPERQDRREELQAMSDQEAKAFYTAHIEREEKKLALTKQMVSELEQSFTSKQILGYLSAEERFKKEVLSKVKERMKENKAGMKQEMKEKRKYNDEEK